jgi:HEAT repeat protein
MFRWSVAPARVATLSYCSFMQWWSLKRLKSASPRSRLSAVQKLGHEGDLSLVHPLTEILADDSAEVRTAAAQALGRIRNEQVIAPLAARLRVDPEPEVRLAIVTSLHALQSPDAIPSLVEALADGSGEVGWKAAQALKLLKWEPADDVERASFLLATTRFEDVIAIGQSAIGPLIKIAQGTTYQRSIRAVEALSIVGGAQAVRPLLECLECADFTVRSAAATALGEVGDGRALDPLINALRDTYHQVCLAACISLGKLGDERAVEPVIAVLQHQAPDVRTAAVETLGKLRDRRSVPGLVQALSDSDNIVRESAAMALGFIRDEAAIEHLVVALTDSQPTIRQAASTALSRIQPHWQETEAAARAIPALQSALKSKDYWIRHSAADVLKKFGIGSESETALFTDSDGARRKRVAMQTILSAMLEDSDRAFRQAAAETFGRIGLAESIPILVNRLTDQDRGVKRAAARSLEVLRWQTDVRLNRARQLVALERWSEAVALGDEAIEPLVESFLWNDPGVRRRASEALVHIGGSQAAAALQSLSASSVPAIREEAATALGALNSSSTRKRST